MDQFEQTKRQIREFTEERDWDKFHNPKDLAIALSIEASELLEVFLWKDVSGAERERVEEELADVFNYAFLLADKYGFDVATIIKKRLRPMLVSTRLISLLGQRKNTRNLSETQ